jgi:Uma2 family endonuclease
MMAALPQKYVSPEEYLALERAAETRNAYLDGEIFAMTGASRPHNLITANVLASLHGQLRGRDCEAYASDMRVHVPTTGLYTYPDVVVSCGDPSFLDAELDTLLDPVVLVEVLSPSTEDHDRGSKFVHYRSIPSFREYLLIAQENVHVEHMVRQGDGRWLLTELRDPQQTVTLEAIDCSLVLAEIYESVPGIALIT